MKKTIIFTFLSSFILGSGAFLFFNEKKTNLETVKFFKINLNPTKSVGSLEKKSSKPGFRF